MIDVKEVAAAAKRGLVSAQRIYESWSGWWWAPPEYVGTMGVAKAVHRLESVKWVTLEHNVRDALREARGGMGRPADNLSKRGRFDIVVWGTNKPQGVIEVKTGDTRRSAGTWHGYATRLRMPRESAGVLSPTSTHGVTGRSKKARPAYPVGSRASPIAPKGLYSVATCISSAIGEYLE